MLEVSVGYTPKVVAPIAYAAEIGLGKSRMHRPGLDGGAGGPRGRGLCLRDRGSPERLDAASTVPASSIRRRLRALRLSGPPSSQGEISRSGFLREERAAGQHRRAHLFGFAADVIFSIASLTVKLAVLARGGNSLKLASRLATKLCAGIRMNVRRANQSA
jgi:hypothetical protein